MANKDDIDKALACIGFLFEAVSDPEFGERYPDENAECRRRLGAGWNFMTVMQWLSGKKAVAAIQAFPKSVEFGQLSGQQLMIFHHLAMQFCAEHDASGAVQKSGLARSLAKLFQSLNATRH